MNDGLTATNFFLLSPLFRIRASPTKIKICPSIWFYFNYSHSLNCFLFVLKFFFYFFFNFIFYLLILFDFISNMVLIFLVDIYSFVNWTYFSISSLIILIHFIFMSNLVLILFFFGSFFKICLIFYFGPSTFNWLKIELRSFFRGSNLDLMTRVTSIKC